MRSFVLVLPLALLSSSAVAQPANWRSMTPEQLNSLPKEQAALLPLFEYLERIDPSMKLASWELITATMFSRLLFAVDSPIYPFGPYLVAAVREFQSDIGVKADGVLKFGEFEQVMGRVQALDKANFPIFPPFKHEAYITDKFVSFGGTWIIEGDKHAFPVNFTIYKCYRDEMLCYTAEGYIMGSTGQWTLNVESEVQKIIKWDASELLMEDNARCRVSTISLNLKTKDTVMITRDKGGTCETGYAALPKLTTPRISRLVDGFKSVQKANQAERETIQRGFAKRMQGIVQGLK